MLCVPAWKGLDANPLDRRRCRARRCGPRPTRRRRPLSRLGQLTIDVEVDLRDAISVVVEDISRTGRGRRISLTLPDAPVASSIDPDTVGILCRNLIDNALQHGDQASPVDVALSPGGELSVANGGPLVSAERLAALTGRFERNGSVGRGSGIGLSIVTTIADRIGSRLELRSPRPGADGGFEARIAINGDSGSPTRSLRS